MKYIKPILSIFLIIKGGHGVYRFASDYSSLSPFGKGFLWGNIALLVIGLFLAWSIFSKRKSIT